MNNIQTLNPAPYRVLGRWSIFLAACVMGIALAVLAGWQWDIGMLRRPVRSFVAMNPTTALAFLLSTLAFLSLALPPHFPKQRIFGRIMAIVVMTIGAVRLIGYFVPSWAGADQWLYTQRLQADLLANNSNGMAANTAACFVLLGYSLFKAEQQPEILLPDEAGRKNQWPLADLTALLTGILSLISLIGYLYRSSEFLGLLRYFPMAVHTALCFGMLSFALLFSSAHRGILKVFTGPLIGSVTARRLLPFAYLLPIALGWVRLYAYWHGHLSTELGVTLLVTSIILCFLSVIWYNAFLLNRKDEQRCRAEANLLASESRWKGLVSSVKDIAIFLVDPDGRVMSWNDGAARIKGYRSEEIIGRPISVFYADEEVQGDQPQLNLQQARISGSHYSEGWRVRKDGSRFWAETVFTAIYDAGHEVESFVKITRDATGQKLANEKIAYLARLIEDTSDAVFSTDNKSRITTWNLAAEKLFGYSAAEVIGQSAVELMRPQLNEDMRQPIRRELEEKGYWKGEIVYLDHQGVKHSILQSVSDIRDSEGKPDGYVIVGRDVTQWKVVEEQLRQFNTELEGLVQQKTEAIVQSNAELRALASHLQDVREEERAAMAREVHDELGQQLTGLKMDLALIEKKWRKGESEALSSQLKATTALLETAIRTVRKIALELRPSILDDLGLLAALEWQSQEFEKRSGIRTVFSSSVDTIDLPPAVSIGLFRICQESLTNVARHAGATKVCITFQQIEDRLILAVQDDGKGLDTRQQNNAGRPRTLGLIGMNERALMMGGQLDIVSAPGQGLTLTITIPINPCHSQT
jgi:PAS domain S-box-containing protein